MRKFTTLLLCFCAILLASTSVVLMPTVSNAERNQPNWLIGDVGYTEGTTLDTGKECVSRTVTIEGIIGRVYLDNPNDSSYTNNITSTTHELCVYEAKGYSYARYQRGFYVSPWVGATETGVAFSFGSGNMRPSFDMGMNTTPDQLFLGSNSDAYIKQTYIGGPIRYYLHLKTHVSVADDGSYTIDNNPDYVSVDIDGREIGVDGIGTSFNKHWISFTSPNIGVFVLNTETIDLRRISNRYEFPSWYAGARLSVTSVSDDGEHVVFGGFGMSTEVINVHDCGVLNEKLVYNSSFRMPLASPCPYVDLTGATTGHSQPTGYSGMRAFDRVRMTSSGGLFSYWDNYKWNTIYAPNYLQPGQLYYLAMGDSYASGEGDVTLDGADHYMPGTNIYGDYKNGIPRETCHVSLRSYPMRIAEVMQLTKGVDMQSIACSGAVMSDVLSSDKKSTDYVDTGYLGQSTQRISDSGSRLAGVSSAAQLQDEAREEYLPGRVQQIELIKKTQPLHATIMMSGNDLGFGDVLTTCATNSLPASDETCDYAYGDGLKGQAQKIHDIYPKLVEFYKDIREVSPRTTIYVIGYPQFMDTSGVSCPEMLDLYTQTERQSIHDLISYANSVIRNAALDAGVKYIDVSDALVGKQLCGSGTGMTGVTDAFATMIYTEYMKSLTTADSNIAKYVNLLPTGELNKIALQLYVAERAAALLNDYLYSPATVISNVGQELSHPNAIGHEAMFDVIKEGLGDDLLESSVCNQKVVCPSGATLGQPNVENYLPGLSLTGDTVYISGGDNVMVGHETSPGKMTIGALVKSLAGQFVRIAVGAIDGDVDPSQPVTVELHSQQVVLGTMSRVGDIYELETSLSQDIAVGLHMLHVKGTLTDGRLFDIDSPVFVEGPHGDMDDDGIADSVDACAFAEPSGVDKDRDGIDDDCDLNISQSTVESPDVTNRPILEDKINKILLTRTTGMDKYLTSEVFGQDGSAKNGGIDGVGLFSYAAVDDGGQADNPSSAPYWLVAVGLVGIAGLCLTVWLRSRRG